MTERLLRHFTEPVLRGEICSILTLLDFSVLVSEIKISYNTVPLAESDKYSVFRIVC